MEVFLNEIEQQKMLSQIPMALRQHKLAEIERGWMDFGVKFRGYKPGVLLCDITGMTRASLMQFLESCGAVAVTVTPMDIRVLFDNQKNQTVWACQQALKNPDIAAEFTMIPIDTVFEKLERLAWDFQATDKSEAVTIVEMDTPQITQELNIDAGLSVIPTAQEVAAKMKPVFDDDAFDNVGNYDAIDREELNDLDRWS